MVAHRRHTPHLWGGVGLTTFAVRALQARTHVTHHRIRRLSVPRAVPLRRVALAVYIALNLVAVNYSISFGTGLDDWRLWQSLPDRLADGTAYVPAQGLPPFVWSPVAAWFMSVIATVGYWPWVIAHVAALPLLRSPMLILVTASSWAFWWDTASAHAMTFVLVSGIAAMRGGRFGALVYLGLLLLMPRPVQVPLAVWLLWQDRSLWRPFAIMFFAHLAVVVASGLAPAWIVASVTYTATDGLGIGPTRLFGISWLFVGIVLGIWLTYRGHPGWAGIAVTPYLLPQYLLMPLVEAPSSKSRVANVHLDLDGRTEDLGWPSIDLGRSDEDASDLPPAAVGRGEGRRRLVVAWISRSQGRSS